MKRLVVTTILLCSTFFLSGCGSSSASSSVGTASACTTSPAPTYNGSAAVVINNQCASCHQHQNQFNSYVGVVNDASNIASLVGSGAMPQGSTLSDADKNTILQWVACAAKQ